MDNIKLEIRKLNQHWERSSLEHPGVDSGLLLKPESTPPRPSAGKHVDSPDGHRHDNNHRDLGFGSVTTFTHVPVKGTTSSPPPTMPKAHGSTFESSSTRPRSSDSGGFLMGKLPKVPFPIFDGENPKLWISRCEKYFVIYHVDPSMWVKVSVMKFSGAAARWFQAVEKRLAHDSKRFGKEQFSGLVDRLLAYESSTDSLYYATRFVDGLREDIRAVVLIQRPGDLDTACTLALLQEEVAEPARCREFCKPDSGF
ncbi:uncharacterized protein C2845_PM04G10910 [Panicum miliaceum]|uniref:Retrotransposon gag domain-containing protein n=1 Tax=Panicum miliaceum TaxID=4540 RepID=A0A3L6QSX5_PANMI|nr:uncharacterized protein C2845_PM04G10910 [Panicum miliaceum]